MPIASELAIVNTASADTLMQTIFGNGVTITSGTATISGVGVQSGTYSGGDATLGDIAPADTGIILSTGDVANFTNTGDGVSTDTNTASGTSLGHGGAGDADLDLVSGQSTEDAVVLEADFTTSGNFITMLFTFSSEEYLEFVNSGVNDAFGVWVNGTYAPFTPASSNLVSIDTINDVQNSNLYLNNDANLDTYNTEMDGTTVLMSIKAPVNPGGATNTIKIALADGGDDAYDTNVLIAANSVQAIALAFDDQVTMEPNTAITVDVLDNDIDTNGSGLTITEINGNAIAVGGSVILPTGETITLNADGNLTVESDADVGSQTFTYQVVDGAGNIDIGYVTINTEAAIAGNFIVEGTANNDLIDSSYLDDPQGDRIDNSDHSDGSNADSIQAGAGDDTVFAGADADTIDGGSGDDALNGQAGADSIIGGTGDDTLTGGDGNDTMDGGSGRDTFVVSGTSGADTIIGGELDEGIGDQLDHTTGNATATTLTGNGTGTATSATSDITFSEIEIFNFAGGGDDSFDGAADTTGIRVDSFAGADTITTGSGNDSLFSGDGDDSLAGGEGVDIYRAGGGDDTIALANDFGNDDIQGGETGETDGDTLDLSAITDDLTIDLSSANSEAGSVSDGSSTANFAEIETIILGSGRDTLTLANGGGDDTVEGFNTADSGDGTAIDQLDVSGLDDDFGNPVNTSDVTVTDTNGDGSGDAILSFPNGESITLTGVLAADLSTTEQLIAIGIPDAAVQYTNVSQLISFGSFAELDTDEGTNGFEGSTAPIIGTTLSGSAANANVVSFDYLDLDGDGRFEANHLNAGEDLTVNGISSPIDEIVIVTLELTFIDGTSSTETGIGYQLENGEFYVGDFLNNIEGETVTSLEITGISETPDSGDLADFSGGGNYDLDAFTFVDPLNYIVEGDGTANLIDGSYTDDPQGDQIDNSDALDGSQDDSVTGGAGNDTILSGAGNDSVDAGDDNDSIDGGAGNDTLFGAAGSDTIIGGDGADSIFGNEDADSIEGGIGDDTIEGGTGNDTIFGGAGNDSINGAEGDDSIVGGTGNDFLRGSFGNDTISGGTGNDTLWGGFGDDSLIVNANFGDYTIEGEEVDEVLGDTMDVSAVTDDLTWDLSNANPEAGSFTDGVNTGTYVDIETIVLGSGTDTLVLDTFGGSNTVSGFDVPTDTGGGTFSGNDLLDVSGLEDFDGNPTHTGNVTVTEVGGNAVLTFANGATLTLTGVPAADVSTPAQLIAMGIPEGPDGFVDGTAGDDTIDVNYTGDPNFDRVDNDDALLLGAVADDDHIRAGAGNDSVVANAGDDTVEGGTGNDTILGGGGNDTLSGEADEDSLIGGLGDDSLIGGAGDDTLNGQIGDDVLEGGDGSDSFALEDDFGNDTIVGGEVDDAAGDTLDMSGVGGAISYDLTGVDSESGTVTDGTGTITFSEIENITLSSGLDTLVLANGSGDDTVSNFTAPILAGDGSFFGADQLDVSTMTDGNGALVNTGDVLISDTVGDGSGDTILTFPGGETLTLVGVLPSAFPTPEALAAIGIPLADYIVEGTGVGELIDGSYLGDPEGDIIDAGDAENGSDDDIVEAGGGDDTILSGAGADSVFADDGADDVTAGAGNDTVFGGDGADSISGGTGDDSLFGQVGNDSISGDAGDDSIEGGSGVDTLLGGADDDTLSGGGDSDSLEGGTGNDSLLGGAGDDTLAGGAGNDQMEGGFGDDTFLLTDGFGTDTIDGEADLETNGDTLDASGVAAEGVDITYSGSEAGTLTGDISGDTADFSDIENIVATSNDDTINAALDGAGLNLDAGAGDDLVTGGTGSDTIDGGAGSDTISGGAGGDSITAGAGDDTINVAQGDTVTGGDGDDFFNIVDLAEGANDVITIVGGEGDETDGDTLALNGLHGSNAINIIDPDDVNGGLSGNVTLLDGTVINFTNIENIICFVPGSEITTPFGGRMIEDLKIGDEVVTQDNGVQRISWIGKTTVAASEQFAPVRFDRSTFPGASADLLVSPQHRMLFKGYEAELLFGENEVLIPAVHLIDGKSVTRETVDTVTYIHIMFEQHEIIFANGIATESFHPGSFGVDSLAPRAREELFALFPEMRSDLASYGQSARTSLRAREARALVNF